MIWEYLTLRQLESAISQENFQRFEMLLPVLLGANHDPTALYKKETLTKLFNAFAPANILSDRNFMHDLLNQLPPELMSELCDETQVGSRSDLFAANVDAHVNKGWGDENYCLKFLEWAKLPDHFFVPKRDPSPAQEAVMPLGSPFKVLKDFQFDVFLRARHELNFPRSRFLIQMPTGSGKTRTAMEVLTQYLNESEDDSVIVWLAHSQELCEQSLQCFCDTWRHVAQFSVEVIRAWGNAPSLPYDSRGRFFIVASFQSLYSHLRKNPVAFQEIKDRVKIVVVDEAHKIVAPTYNKVSKALIGESTSIIGLTATPGRSSSNLAENEELAEFFFKKILEIKSPDDHSVIKWLRGKEILSSMRCEPLITNVSFRLDPKQRQYVLDNFDLPPGFLNTLGQSDARNLEIIKRLQTEHAGNHSILFFACSVEHSKFICSILIYLGITAAHVDGGTPQHLRNKYIDQFRKQEIRVLCNYGVLSTGFDAPKTDVVFISRPTASLILYSQMLGRGLRGPAIGGTKTCKVIDVKDNIDGFDDQEILYEYFQDYWIDRR